MPGANPDCPLEKPLSDLGMYERFQTLEASPDAAYHQRGPPRGRPYDLADAAESAQFRERRPGPGDLSPRDCQIEPGGSTPLQLADPPSLRMLARKRGPVHTQFGPILATIRERPPKKSRVAAPKSWSRKAACAYIQRRVKRYRTHKIASAPAIEATVITQKNIIGYALSLSLGHRLQRGRYPGRGCL